MMDAAEEILQWLLDGCLPVHLRATADLLRCAILAEVRRQQGYEPAGDPIPPPREAWKEEGLGPGHPLGGKANSVLPRGAKRQKAKEDPVAIVAGELARPKPDPRKNRLARLEADPQVFDVQLN